jgi:YHS domain-containing protein
MNKTLPRLLLATALTIGGAAVAPDAARAFDPSSPAAVNVDAGRLALQGYDPVAYFTAGKPARGYAAYAVEHDGATYRFASAENMKAFQADPASYAPQYGGFCAMGAALGKKFDIDPTQFRVVDGRLFLNKDAEVAKLWNEDVPGHVAKADQAWPEISEKAPKAL